MRGFPSKKRIIEKLLFVQPVVDKPLPEVIEILQDLVFQANTKNLEDPRLTIVSKASGCEWVIAGERNESDDEYNTRMEKKTKTAAINLLEKKREITKRKKELAILEESLRQ